MATATHNDNNTGTRRATTETRPAAKTTELMAYIAAVLAVAITAFLVNDDGGVQGGNGVDPFSALDALQLITYLTIGYMLARGLAKSGTHGSTDDHDA